MLRPAICVSPTVELLNRPTDHELEGGIYHAISLGRSYPVFRARYSLRDRARSRRFAAIPRTRRSRWLRRIISRSSKFATEFAHCQDTPTRLSSQGRNRVVGYRPRSNKSPIGRGRAYLIGPPRLFSRIAVSPTLSRNRQRSRFTATIPWQDGHIGDRAGSCPESPPFPQSIFRNFSCPELPVGDGETGKIALNERQLSGTRICRLNVGVYAFSACPLSGKWRSARTGGLWWRTDRLLSGRRVAVADIARLPPFPKRIGKRDTGYQ